jgi:uncharacterized protein YecE (DUF72 family)
MVGSTNAWIVIESQSRKADAALWTKELQTLEQRLKRQLRQLSKTVFACRPDACEALLAFQDQLKKHQLANSQCHHCNGAS